ncbi:MAG: fumarylacetoacetate hydrolase family protein [Bacteriovoracaceae bacterium]
MQIILKTYNNLNMDKIICLGKNYSDHIKEMNEPTAYPLLFLKPASSFKEIKNNEEVKLPWHRGAIHYECEIVLKLYKKMVIGVGLGMDLVLRELQKELKEKGHPWERAKVFKNSALATPLKGAKDFDDWQNEVFTLKINGEVRQQAKMSDAILTPNEMIHYIDENFPLCDGDLIFTGTPSGVGELHPGDECELIFGPINYKFRFIANE